MQLKGTGRFFHVGFRILILVRWSSYIKNPFTKIPHIREFLTWKLIIWKLIPVEFCISTIFIVTYFRLSTWSWRILLIYWATLVLLTVFINIVCLTHPPLANLSINTEKMFQFDKNIILKLTVVCSLQYIDISLQYSQEWDLGFLATCYRNSK